MPRIVTTAHFHVGHASPTPNPFHKTPYTASQNKVEAQGDPVIRIGDSTSCGDPATGSSSKVKAVGAFVHRAGDSTGGHGSWPGNQAESGAPKVNVGS